MEELLNQLAEKASYVPQLGTVRESCQPTPKPVETNPGMKCTVWNVFKGDHTCSTIYFGMDEPLPTGQACKSDMTSGESIQVKLLKECDNQMAMSDLYEGKRCNSQQVNIRHF